MLPVPCPKLIPQAVHNDLTAFNVVDGELQPFLISQRDCVENLVRNTFNLAFLQFDGTYRSGAQAKLCGSILGRFYEGLTDAERISPDPAYGRAWLDATIGHEAFGVQYDPLQGQREVLTGMDNILSLMEAMTHQQKEEEHKDEGGACGRDGASKKEGGTQGKVRALRMTNMCKFLSTDTVLLSWSHSPGVLNYTDVGLLLRLRQGGRKCSERVKWLITTEHVCLRHGNTLCH